MSALDRGGGTMTLMVTFCAAVDGSVRGLTDRPAKPSQRPGIEILFRVKNPPSVEATKRGSTAGNRCKLG